MLKLLEKHLPGIWTNETYSNDFNASPSVYKDFDHALKHVVKAAAKLLEITEQVDHSGNFMVGDTESMEKYLADLVICTVRLALKAPGGAIDLEQAVLDRIKRKMGVSLKDRRRRSHVQKKHRSGHRRRNQQS